MIPKNLERNSIYVLQGTSARIDAMLPKKSWLQKVRTTTMPHKGASSRKAVNIIQHRNMIIAQTRRQWPPVCLCFKQEWPWFLKEYNIIQSPKTYGQHQPAMSPLVLFKNAWSVGGRKRFENIAAWPARSLSPVRSKHTNHLVSIGGFISAKMSHQPKVSSAGLVAVAVGLVFLLLPLPRVLVLYWFAFACYWAYLFWFLKVNLKSRCHDVYVRLLCLHFMFLSQRNWSAVARIRRPYKDKP